MKPLDHSFQRLLSGAARARRETPETIPFPIEARVLAQWRDGETEDEFAVLVQLFRRAAVCAVVIMTLSGGWNYVETRNEAGTLALASYAMKMQLPP